MTAVEQLASFVVERSDDDLSEKTRYELKVRILDSLGCALGALAARPVQAIRAEVDDLGGRPLCTLIGGGASSPDRVALYNGALVRYARRTVDVGADAIVVSNHGGNVLDGSVPTLPVLPEIVEAVGDKIEVLIDSGVRRGVDVVKALALGAKGVLLGRAYVYALPAPGEPGVRYSSCCSVSRSTRRSRSSASSQWTSPTPPSWASATTMRGDADRSHEVLDEDG
jgi:hypothetical protein